MLQYSIYSVISPEGCASILWKNASKAADASEAMAVTADRIRELGLIDEVIAEPCGSAYRNADAMAKQIKRRLQQYINELQELSQEELLNQRYQRLMSYGQWTS
jgi:acetyl-CoA carboxylase carboxyl transferase subunit alpha